MKLGSAALLALSINTPVTDVQDLSSSCLQIPAGYVPFGEIDKEFMQSWAPDLRYIVNPQYLSIVDGHENYPALRHKFVANSRGSHRVVGAADLEGKRTYSLTQSVLFEDGFDWGGLRESGKFGFGLGGGSTPAGGQMRDDGLSARLVWQGNGDGTAGIGVYAYTADRTQNLPWGDVYKVNSFQIPMGEWFRVTMKITANSSVDVSDGSLSVLIDDEVVMWQDSIRWQGSGFLPMVDQLLYSTFYGGNTDDWSPGYTTHAQFSNVCLSD